MNRRFVLLISGLLALLPVRPVYASGMEGCSVEWKLVHPAMTGCDNMGALGPGNDTRANLLLLLFDRHGLPQHLPATAEPITDWRGFRDFFISGRDTRTAESVDGEGSRCNSNKDGAVQFEAALDAAPALPPDERAILSAARKAFAPTCSAKSATAADAGDAVQHLHSVSGQALAAYLRGAAAFYDGRYDEAAMAFAGLKGNAQPWIAETAAYMAARVEVNRLQMGAFDEYGSFKGGGGTDQQVATRAEESLDAYLRDHPNGRYASSARGLLRRVDWLAGKTEKLAARYAALLATPSSARDIDDLALAEEIDSKLLPQLTPKQTTDPTLLAVIDLLRMRDGSGSHSRPMSLDELEAQRSAFASATPLYEYLLAVHAFYIEHENGNILKMLPDATRRRDGDYLWFSRQYLRGLALEALGDRNARGFWTEFYPGAMRPMERPAIELGLAIHDESHGRLKDIFAAGSLVHTPAIREILLNNVADAALLRQQAHDPLVPVHERETALYALLYKEVTRGHYADFVADVAAVPSNAGGQTVSDGRSHPPLSVFTQTKRLGDIACPPLPTTAAELARDPLAVRAHLCLAEFARVNDWDGNALDSQPPKDQLGATPSLFAGKPYARGETYKEIIAQADAPAADKAYALFRAVKCYAPVGNNQCGGEDVPLTQRKAWYMRLKKDYPSSRWTKELTYWW